jgi:hypothetical protein
MKYSDNFNRDFKWFLKMRHEFNFSGKDERDQIIYDKNGVDGKKAFYLWDSQGKIVPTKHPNLLFSLLKTKGSVNLHIKMFAEDRAACNWGLIEIRALCIKWKAPDWFRQAVERQKVKYYA